MAATVHSRAGTVAVASAAAAAERRQPRVAVVGAGFAGLAAALALQRSGRCDVTVLEASSRPGGRACTQRLPGGDGDALELGATWFHGLGTAEAPNPVFRHAVDQGLISASPDSEKWWSSQFLLPGAAEPLSKEQQLGVTHALAAWTGVVEELPPTAGGTTADHLRAAWAGLAAAGKLDGEERAAAAARAWRWRELLQRAMDGCHSTSEQSALGLALYDEMEGGVHCALPAGMQTVAEGLAAQVADLRYNHAVQRIRWEGADAGVSISCANGETVEADAAIVTVSLGVLKAQSEALFEPPLPPAKVAALRRLRIGVVDKLFLDFERPDGVPAAAAAAAGGEAGDVAAASGSGSGAEPPVSYALLWSDAWDGSGAGDVKGAVPAAAGVEAKVPAWAKGIFSLRFGGPEVKRQRSASGTRASCGSEGRQAAQPEQVGSEQLPGAEAAGVLEDRQGTADEAGAADDSTGGDPEFNPCAEAVQPTSYHAVAWLTGDAAVASEAASDEEVLGTLRQLAAVFPQIQLPPGASWDRVTLHRSRWGSDPLFRGSYSYLGPDCSPADVAALAAPVYQRAHSKADEGSSNSGGSSSSASTVGAPVLLFAGEACHVMYIGTMHGAYITGQQAAQRLITHWQQEQEREARE